MRRRRRGRFAPPPPTPEGMVWEVDGSELVTAERFGLESRLEMAIFDTLSPEDRADARKDPTPSAIFKARRDRARSFDFGF